MKIKIDLLHEDEDLLVVNKPPHFLSIPDRYLLDRPNLQGYLSEHHGKTFVVHRLDKETSGVICFAKNEQAHRKLSLQFEQRTVDKRYHVLIEGQLYPKEGKIEKAIASHKSKPGQMIVSNRGKASLTFFKALEYFKNYTLVEANIKTGRTHQIRVHFKSIGFPLAIDATYGRREAFFLSELKLRKFKLAKDTEERPLMSRSSLHAHELQLNHPSSGQRMQFIAEYPKDFRATLQQLRKWGK
ncbi:MAG: RluA family pseudouridine synthase [Bacteroidota bacterium]